MCVRVCIIKEKADRDDRRKNNGNCGKLQKAKVVIEIELKQSDVQKKKKKCARNRQGDKKEIMPHCARGQKDIRASTD